MANGDVIDPIKPGFQKGGIGFTLDAGQGATAGRIDAGLRQNAVQPAGGLKLSLRQIGVA